MPALSVFHRTLYNLRWQILCYGLGMALTAVLDVYIYPSYARQFRDMQLPDAMKALIGNADYTSGPGFLGAEFFSWVPPLLVIFGVMAGTSALAGEEVQGTLDLLLAQPISRASLALSKLAAITVAAVIMVAIVGVGWMISVPFVEIDVGYGRLFAATLNIVPIVVFFATFSTWTGATLGRGTATALAAALAVFGFFLSYLSDLVDVVRPLRVLSIFYYNGGAKAITEGVNPLHLLVMLVLIVAMVVLTLRAFERRDIGVSGGTPGWLHLLPHRATPATP